MADLTVRYMGLTLPSPVVVASSSLTNRLENFRAAEDAGAGAVVVRSLFEEQIEAAQTALDEEVARHSAPTSESQGWLPPAQRLRPLDYLKLIESGRKAVKIPVIASLNCAARGSWSDYARQLEEAGAHAIELNVYLVAADPKVSGAEIEQRYLDAVQAVREKVKIPVAVKLPPFFTSFAHMAGRLDALGVNALVLFNRFFQPDIDFHRMALVNTMNLSHPQEMLLPLRWIAILFGRVKADLAASTGVHDGGAVVKQLLAGAQVVQVAAALMRHGIGHVKALREALEDWMDHKGFERIEDFRGTLSQREATDPAAFERAQYVNLILSQND
jgi:dihydroorotate dehydrogenase (fumarate)